MTNKSDKWEKQWRSIIDEWIAQGRSDEQIHGVENFFTGIGGKRIAELLLSRDREYKKARQQEFERQEATRQEAIKDALKSRDDDL